MTERVGSDTKITGEIETDGVETMAVWVERLRDRDNRVAYEALKKLLLLSESCDGVYPYFDCFAGMLEDGSSYIRARGLLLIAANAKWDTEHRVDEVLDDFCRHMSDPKPIIARQCIRASWQIARYKPELAEAVREALAKVQPGRYAQSMAPLIAKDIAEALQKIG